MTLVKFMFNKYTIGGVLFAFLFVIIVGNIAQLRLRTYIKDFPKGLEKVVYFMNSDDKNSTVEVRDDRFVDLVSRCIKSPKGAKEIGVEMIFDLVHVFLLTFKDGKQVGIKFILAENSKAIKFSIGLLGKTQFDENLFKDLTNYLTTLRTNYATELEYKF